MQNHLVPSGAGHRRSSMKERHLVPTRESMHRDNAPQRKGKRDHQHYTEHRFIIRDLSTQQSSPLPNRRNPDWGLNISRVPEVALVPLGVGHRRTRILGKDMVPMQRDLESGIRRLLRLQRRQKDSLISPGKRDRRFPAGNKWARL